jgi:hypothetical protein
MGVGMGMEILWEGSGKAEDEHCHPRLRCSLAERVSFVLDFISSVHASLVHLLVP